MFELGLLEQPNKERAQEREAGREMRHILAPNNKMVKAAGLNVGH